MLISAPSTKVTSVVSFGTAKTGLATVGYELFKGDGTVFQARTTTGVSEIPTGTGSYKVELAASVFTAAFDGYIVWDTGETPTPVYSVEAVRIIDIGGIVWSTSNRNLTGGVVTSVGPVAAGGSVSILQGDDYKNADGRALQWTSTTWPNLTSATILMTAKQGASTFTKSGTVVTPTGTAEVQIELTNVDTSGLAAGSWNFNVVATLSDGDKITLVHSTMTVGVNP